MIRMIAEAQAVLDLCIQQHLPCYVSVVPIAAVLRSPSQLLKLPCHCLVASSCCTKLVQKPQQSLAMQMLAA